MTSPAAPPLIKRAGLYLLNLRRGHDLVVPMKYRTKVPGSDPPQFVDTDWPAGTVIVIGVDLEAGWFESQPAEITGPLSVLWVESTVVDDWPPYRTFRIEARIPIGARILNRVPINGITWREDGDGIEL